MYIFKPNTSTDLDPYLSKSTKNSTPLAKGAESALARLSAPVVQAPVASLNEAVLPVGTVLSNLMDSVVLAGVVSSIGQPVLADYAQEPANQSQAMVDETIAKNAISVLANTANNVVPISSLSDSASFASNLESQSNLVLAQKSIGTFGILDLSNVSALAQAATPTLIKDLSDGQTSVTVINNSNDNVQITDYIAPQAVSETFINTGLGKLTIITPATSVASLSLAGNVEFTATGMEVTSGITVSGASDFGNVILYITGGASRANGSVDKIHLGDGNNVVFDAGDGTIFLDVGSGANTVVLSGMGISGAINFAAHNNALSDTVAIAPSDFLGFEQSGIIPVVTITGLNVNPNSSDKISFLGDIGSELNWAGGSAQKAQVNSVIGDASVLSNWINAAQATASTAHSIAWFHFNGATYILESIGDLHASNVGDTLIQLTGTFTFSGVDGELSTGVINLLG